MTKFWGKLLLINFAMGVVTGIVQEFQFGMAWSAYSRFVGDVFGAPLAMEGLVAFFVESTFLGLWIFGWDRLPKRVHLACAWAFSLASTRIGVLHPGRQLVDAAPGRRRVRRRQAAAELDLGGAGQQHRAGRVPHTIAGAFAVAGAFLVGHRPPVAACTRSSEHQPVWRASVKLGGVGRRWWPSPRSRSPATRRASSCSSSSR